MNVTEFHEPDDTVERMDIREFREAGFLQEVNRLFLHPHGLALEVVVEDDGSERLGGVWDYRDDPEGIVFGEAVDEDKVVRVADERRRHYAARAKLFDQDHLHGVADRDIQPPGWSMEE